MWFLKGKFAKNSHNQEMRNILRNWQFRLIFPVVYLGELVIFYFPCKCADNLVLLFLWHLKTIFLSWNWVVTTAMNEEMKRATLAWAKNEAHGRFCWREKLELPRRQVGWELLFQHPSPAASLGLLLHVRMERWRLQRAARCLLNARGSADVGEPGAAGCVLKLCSIRVTKHYIFFFAVHLIT